METSWLTWLCTIISLSVLVLAFKLSSKKRLKLPPSPAPRLPFLGHFLLLKSPLHQTCHQLSQKLGPIFSLNIGNRYIVVVSSSTLVEECFTKNDIVLANRPKFPIGQYIGYNFSTLVASSYNEKWRNLRRVSAIEVFSSIRLNTFTSIRQDEVRRLLQKLYRRSNDAFARVELRNMLTELTFNNIMRMVSGKRYFGEEEDDEKAKYFRVLIEDVFQLGGAVNPGNFSPFFRWIDYQGYEKKLKRTAEKMDVFLQGMLDEQRRDKSKDTVISHLLSLQESQPEYYNDTDIKGLIIVMLLAGTDTSAVTLEWAMSALLNHPKELEKARAEIDNFAGNDRLINESDISKLPYLQSIVSETFRLFPATPLLIAHESSDDCKIGGYDIPKETILLVNAWAVHRDPTVWDDPTSFKPERFRNGEAGPPKLIPFGMGRRSCPGSGLAQRMVGLTLGSLIQCFEWERIDEDVIDMTEGEGVSMPKAVPLVARCRARNVLHGVLGGA
uniref:(+)-piperitol/(+)-sesamin synthase n=1 Tax=Scoparia dulcis TaxID=107240 RepID=A0A1W7HBX3_SCODU